MRPQPRPHRPWREADPAPEQGSTGTVHRNRAQAGRSAVPVAALPNLGAAGPGRAIAGHLRPAGSQLRGHHHLPAAGGARLACNCSHIRGRAGSAYGNRTRQPPVQSGAVRAKLLQVRAVCTAERPPEGLQVPDVLAPCWRRCRLGPRAPPVAVRSYRPRLVAEGCQPAAGSATPRTCGRTGPSCDKYLESAWPESRRSGHALPGWRPRRPRMARMSRGQTDLGCAKPTGVAGRSAIIKRMAPLASCCSSIRSPAASSSGSDRPSRHASLKQRPIGLSRQSRQDFPQNFRALLATACKTGT
jgi:hypothetical protein